MTAVSKHEEHEEAVRRANAAMRTYTLSASGWRKSPSETVQQVLTDLLHWCDDPQCDFDTVLERARTRHARPHQTIGTPKTPGEH